MKKVVLKLDLPDDEKAKQKAFMTVLTHSGIDSISMDMKEKKLTVIGSVDPVNAVSKLREYWPTNIISVGPAAVEPKKEEPKMEEPKEEGGEEAAKKEEPPKKEEEKKEEAAKKEKPPKKAGGGEKKKEKKAAAPNLVRELVRALPSVVSVISCIVINYA